MVVVGDWNHASIASAYLQCIIISVYFCHMHAHIAWVETDAEKDRNHEKRYSIHRCCINQSVFFLYFFFFPGGPRCYSAPVSCLSSIKSFSRSSALQRSQYYHVLSSWIFSILQDLCNILSWNSTISFQGIPFILHGTNLWNDSRQKSLEFFPRPELLGEPPKATKPQAMRITDLLLNFFFFE